MTEGEADATGEGQQLGIAGSVDPDQTGISDLTPETAFRRTVEEGQRRIQRGFLSLLATGLVGGVDISTGILGLLLMETYTNSKLLGGVGLGIGFISLALARSELFTEDFLVPVSAVVARKARPLSLLRLWVVTLAANLVGGWVVTFLIVVGLPNLDKTAVTAGRFYAGLGIDWRSFSLALLGGLVITLMTWMQHATKSVPAKLAVAITTGFLLGAGRLDHAVVASLLMFAAIHTGHAGFGYGQWAEMAGWAALGNLVGGVGLVTILRLFQVPERVALERQHPRV